MSYQPYCALREGAMFEDIKHPGIPLMKTAEPNKAVLLVGIWLEGVLRPRGSLVDFGLNECVNSLDNPDALVTLTHVRKDPVDPRRKFWKEGDTCVVGRARHTSLKVFAGLFIYEGFGMGNYYGATDQEKVWCDTSVARKKAAAEEVPFVYYDSKDWTDDPDLTREKKEAREQWARMQVPAPA